MKTSLKATRKGYLKNVEVNGTSRLRRLCIKIICANSRDLSFSDVTVLSKAHLFYQCAHRSNDVFAQSQLKIVTKMFKSVLVTVVVLAHFCAGFPR